MRVAIGVVSSLIGVALLAYAYMHPPPSPYVSTGGDSLNPEKVKVLGAVAISRNFLITRREPMFVVRTMVKGDCSVTCEIIDLPGGNLTLEPGAYHNVIRDHSIPSFAQPGHWVLKFSIQWQDRFGRTLSAEMPPLAMEVVP